MQWLNDVSLPRLTATVGREIGVLLTGVALGVLLVRQPAKQACPGPFPGPECLQLAEVTSDILTVSIVAGGCFLVAAAVLDTQLAAD